MSAQRDAMIKAMRDKMGDFGTAPVAPPPPVELFETAEATQGENQKEYAEIIGEPHPSGEKFFFTVYKPEDFDPEVRDLIPEINENVVFDHDYALTILMSIEFGKCAFAFGPPGCGKTLTPEQICARLNYPYYFVGGMGGTEPSDYIGSPWVEDGSMAWKDGPISFIVRHGGYLAYDEPFKSSAQTNMCIQSLLDYRKTLKLYGHPNPVEGTLKAHPQFRIGLMDNVRGFGDDADRYSAEVQDQSFINRCAYKIEVDYQKADVEVEILTKMFPTASESVVKSIVSMANLIRSGWKKRDIKAPFSLRDSAEWLECALTLNDLAGGFKQTYYSAVNEETERNAIKDAWKLAIPSTPLK